MIGLAVWRLPVMILVQFSFCTSNIILLIFFFISITKMNLHYYEVFQMFNYFVIYILKL